MFKCSFDKFVREKVVSLSFPLLLVGDASVWAVWAVALLGVAVGKVICGF